LLFPELLRPVLDPGKLVQPGLDLQQQKPFLVGLRLCRPAAGVGGTFSQLVADSQSVPALHRDSSLLEHTVCVNKTVWNRIAFPIKSGVFRAELMEPERQAW
jgi:hypothetical protein